MFKQYPARDPRQVAAGRAAAMEVLGRWPGLPAYLGGAPLAGLGTPNSDVDLFVVTADETETSQLFAGETRVDVEFVTAEQLIELVARCAEFAVTERDRSQLAFAQNSVLDRLVRFALGEILADGGLLDALRQKVHENSEAVCKLLVARHGVSAVNLAEDACGALEIGSATSAQFSSRQALLCAAEAFLAANGDVYQGSKWVWTRWERTVGSALGSHVRDALEDPSIDARNALWLAQDFLVQAITGDQYEIILDPPCGLPRRRLGVMPTPTSGPVLLNRLDTHAVRVSRQGAILWGLAHGRPREHAVKLTSERLSVPSADVNAYYGQLLSAGVLSASASDHAGH